jgi:2,5-furandicarboxylate decarboxylase 1
MRGTSSRVRDGTIDDLRSFLGLLRARGLMFDIQREVDPVVELGAVLKACEDHDRAAFFHHVRGHDLPVVAGVLGSPERIALALNCFSSTEIFELGRAALSRPIKPDVVGEPVPSQEIEVSGPVNLQTLPIPTHAPLDGGAFINAGVVIARDPTSGRHNLSFCRMQVFEPDLTGIYINLWRHTREFADSAEAEGQNLPFCVAIGPDPVVLMAAAFRYPGDEYEIAGALRGHPIQVVRARTQDTLVPAWAEIILEGEVLAGERRMEGPMAEFTGHYSGTSEQRVARITCITHRKDPIFQTIAGASFEHINLGNVLTREPTLDAAVRKMSPRISEIRIPAYGSGFTVLISMKEPHAGEARTVAIATLASHANVKTAVIVDDDVDISNPVDVLWALSTRVRWDSDCIVVPGAHGSELDPASNAQGVQAKVIIDATLGPERAQRYKKVLYPPIDLTEYVSSAVETPRNPPA